MFTFFVVIIFRFFSTIEEKNEDGRDEDRDPSGCVGVDEENNNLQVEAELRDKAEKASEAVAARQKA